MTKKKSYTKPAIKPTPEVIAQALAELGVDKPWYTCRVVGDRLEFALYGGDVVFWPPDPPVEAGPRARPKEG